MRFQTLGDKSPFVSNQFKNAETVSILRGQPAIVRFNGTDDGLAVVLPSSGGAVQNMRVAAGVALEDVGPSLLGAFQQFGYCRSLMLVRQTRAATTDVWTSEASITSWVLLSINSVANAFQTLIASSAYASTDALTLNNMNQYHAVLAQTLSNYVSSASATSDSRTAITASVKAFVRML